MRPRVPFSFSGQTDMGGWTKSLRMFNAFGDNARQSIRPVAHQTGFSKSRVPRLKQALMRREKPPESWGWETAEGRCWLLRLVVATLETCGLTRGVGAETIRELFSRLRRETPVGCAPRALRGVRQALEHAILETAAAWEHEGIAEGAVRSISGAVEATFLARMLLVVMDRGSGSLLCAAVAADRPSAPWPALVEARLKAPGGGGLSRVRDRAQALMTLAETGWECRRRPARLPLIHALVQSSARASAGRLRPARQALHHAQEHLRTAPPSPPSGVDVEQAPAGVEARAAEVPRWERVPRPSRPPLATVSLRVSPWRLGDSTRQTADEVADQ